MCDAFLGTKQTLLWGLHAVFMADHGVGNPAMHGFYHRLLGLLEGLSSSFVIFSESIVDHYVY